jgi:hypothetical protein
MAEENQMGSAEPQLRVDAPGRERNPESKSKTNSLYQCRK